MNLPLHAAPLLAPFTARSTPHRTLIRQGNQQKQVGIPMSGGHTFRQRKDLNRAKMQFIKSLENQRIENATNITPNYKGIVNEALIGNRFTANYNQKELAKRSSSKYWYHGNGLQLTKGGPFDPDQLDPRLYFTASDDSDPLVPEWFFSHKGTKFDKSRSDRLGLEKPLGMTPQQERVWFAKVTYQRVKDEVLAQGGTELQAKEIYANHRKNFLPYAKGGSGIVASISELNRMAEKYSPGIQLRTTKYTKDGQDYYRWVFKDKDGKHTMWDFEREAIDDIVKEYSKTQWAKDHLIPVKDRNRVGGGYIGADNEYNLEHLLHFLNIKKSNTTQLYPGLLKESGVPETFSEYINMKLYPQNYEGMFVPQKWVENFQKIVLAEYYEKTAGVKSPNKKKAIMDELIELHSERFKDPAIVQGLELLEEALGQQVAKNMEEGVAAGNEVPAWIGLLQKPPGGWNSKDPWWTSLPEDARTRYKYVYDYNQRTILKKPYKRPPFRQSRMDE